MKNRLFIFISICLILTSAVLSSCKTAPVATEEKPASKSVNSEYKRSIENLQTDEQISFDTFEADKKAILKIIEELSVIMKNQNFNAWCKYITQDSKFYWSSKTNLKNISSRLPTKSLTLKTLEDYFRFVFTPSRQGKPIDEIRYLSSSLVKAVQVRDNQDIIYYTFKKIDGKWLVELDKLE
ncbi:MAG: hypothetical protein K5839_02695 [Treponemataceae bacterium]|nr:hypothetical protein [Treponemataceae bacterium]